MNGDAPSREDAQRAAGAAARAWSDAQIAAILAAIVPGTVLDPWLFALVVGYIYGKDGATAPGAPDPARRTVKEWTPHVNKQIAEWAAERPNVVPEPNVRPILATAPPIETPHGAPPGPPIPAPPPGLPEPIREAWIQARTRGAELARGLGAYVDDVTQARVGEIWDGEAIRVEADPDLRARNVEAIRRATADAIATGRTPGQLASDLGHIGDDWARNWDRIAATELQMAANEGVAIAAVREFGYEARVARVPNADACPSCRAAFLGPDGAPVVFTVAELVGNGSNAGRRASAWLPTLTPLHPNCRCGTITVPPGFTIDRTGRLRRIEPRSSPDDLPQVGASAPAPAPAPPGPATAPIEAPE